MKKHYVFFDLDGTLTDSAPGITRCVAIAIQTLGYPSLTQKELNKFVGPSLYDGFTQFGHLSHTDALKAVDIYRTAYKAGGMFDNRVYEGIESLLIDLNNRGVKCFVTTSKPRKFAKMILDHFGLLRYFKQVYGPTLKENGGAKEEVIAKAIKGTHSHCLDKMVMIGDREYDNTGALKNHIDCIGVGYGFGSQEEFKEARYFVEKVSDLKQLLEEIAS